MVAIVDDEDFELVSKYKWQAAPFGRTWSAHRTGWPKSTIFMHRVIMNAPDGFEVDHIDGNGLNNTKENLRICTHAENTKNQKLRIDSKSGYKGVDWHIYIKKWRARIRVNYEEVSLGYFDSAIDAAEAYDRAAREYFGEFAKTNF